MVLSASTASGLIKKLLLCLANRQLVEVWRAGRPLGGWAAEGSESVSRYLVAAASHHIRSAWSPDWAEDEGATQWLSDFVDGRQDAIPVHTARALGAVRVAQLAKIIGGVFLLFSLPVCRCAAVRFPSMFVCLSSLCLSLRIPDLLRAPRNLRTNGGRHRLVGRRWHWLNTASVATYCRCRCSRQVQMFWSA